MISGKTGSRFFLLVLTLIFISLPGNAADKKASPKPSLPAKEAATVAKEEQVNSKNELIDINKASAAKLMTLKGIGKVTAQDIINGRPHAKKDQLKSRKIISDAGYEEIKDRIIAKQSPK